jgi:hypothetical protein
MNFKKTIRFFTLGVLAVGSGALASCDTVDRILDVDNPAQIDESLLQSRNLVEILVNSVVGEFQDAYDDPFIWRGSMFTDEQITGINWEQTARLSQRIVNYTEGDPDFMFSSISRARSMADSTVGRFRGTGGEALLDNPESDARLAMALNYAGYSYIMMADAMCEATVDVGSEIYQPTELYQFAVDRFNDALGVANAAGDQDMVNLAQVGLARANLGVGNASAVMSAAAAVDDDFVYWANYSSNSDDENNTLFSRVTGGNHALGMHPHFLQGTFPNEVPASMQTDPRIQHTTEFSLGHNQLTPLYKPYQSRPFSGYTGETQADGGTVMLYERDTDIRVADKLEAMHHYYEAAGPNGSGPWGTTLEFVNARRAYGNQDPVNLSGDALMAELREQRGRDLFLGGHRLGDLRRWDRQGVGNFFPSGPHPVSQWGQYGDAKCYPLPVEEYEGNPNINKPG